MFNLAHVYYLNLVEAAGVEPASEGPATRASTSLVPVFVSHQRLPGTGILWCQSR